jgi:alkanesulfonate monooxygenase SsuD/methylene tetrahydromethanopterin reductase-like flavin-dependent oxidoreductase (luciferase family)
MVAVAVIAAETDEIAQRLFTTPQQRLLRLIRNQPVELLPPVDSMQTLWRSGEREAVQSRLSEAIVGSEATVKLGMDRLARETGADELIVVTDTYEDADRIESYRRVARAANTICRATDAVGSEGR